MTSTLATTNNYTWLKPNSKALIVDDSKSVRDVVSQALAAIGLSEVKKASNINEALNYTKSEKFDLILCDFNIDNSELTGQILLESIRQNQDTAWDTIFFMVTAERTYDRVMAIAETTPDDYLLKPFTLQSLITRLDRISIKKKAFSTATSLIKSGKIEEAAAWLELQLSNSENKYKAEMQKLCAHLYMRLGFTFKAKEIYTDVLNTKKTPWAKFGLAKIYSQEENYQAANSELRELIESTPVYTNTYDLLLENLMQLDLLEEALEVAEKAVSVSPKNVSRLQQAANIALKGSNDQKFVKYMEEAIKHGKHSQKIEPLNLIKLLSVYQATNSKANIDVTMSLFNRTAKHTTMPHADLVKSIGELLHGVIAKNELYASTALAKIENYFGLKLSIPFSYAENCLEVLSKAYLTFESSHLAIAEIAQKITARYAQSRKDLDYFEHLFKHSSLIRSAINSGFEAFRNSIENAAEFAKVKNYLRAINVLNSAYDNLQNETLLLNANSLSIKLMHVELPNGLTPLNISKKELATRIRQSLSCIIHPQNKSRAQLLLESIPDYE